MKLFPGLFLSFGSATFLNFALALPVMSISPQEAQKKLEVVAVFALANDEGVLYEISRGDASVVPLYLQARVAKTQLELLLKSREDLKGQGQILAFTLNRFYEKANQLRKNMKSAGKSLVTPLVIPEADMAKAVGILQSEGLSDEQIKTGLRVPVFFSEPMLFTKTSQGTRRIFFMGYNQLDEAIKALPRDRQATIKKRVADLQTVLSLIEKSDDDIYAFFPTEDYLELRKASNPLGSSRP